jgi:hypothetical protein
MYGFHQAQLLSNMAIGIFTLRQQLRGLLSTNWPGAKTPYVEYLVVGGGGGGGGNNAGNAGGGGAGGVLTGLLPVTPGVSYVTTVGGGGAGGGGGATGTSGQNSSINSVIAVGGGGGAPYASSGTPPGAGGSGGGIGQGGGTNSKTGGQGIFGQGNAGGSYTGSGDPLSGYGGGGAGTVGLNGSASSGAYYGGNGGAGISSAISGTVTPYGGGGGGGSQGGTAGGTGGVGGGGFGYGANAANGSAPAATTGAVNTGGGGGGTGENNGSGSKAGGSGIVIISYPDIYPALTTTSGSPTVGTSGSGSISFNGSSQYLSYANATPLQLASSAWTVEGFFYSTSGNGTDRYLFMQESGTTDPQINWQIRIKSTNVIRGIVLINSGTSSAFVDGTTTINLNTWYHIALTCDGAGAGANLRLWVNGSYEGGTTFNSSTLNTSASPTRVMAFASNSSYTAGYASNLRIVKGTAIYTGTGAITVPTAPLQPVTNTQLLLNSNSGAYLADTSVNSYVPTATGSPTWNQSSPFATGLGYKNRVYTWSSTGSGAFTV